MRFCTIFAATLLVFIALQGSVDASLQDELTDSTFWPTIKKEPIYFVKFYLKTCRTISFIDSVTVPAFHELTRGLPCWKIAHCIRLAPTWDRVAEALTGIIRLGEVEAREQPKISNEFHIQGVPAMFILKNTQKDAKPQQIEYQGDRSFPDLISFVLKNLPVRDVKLGEHVTFSKVVGTLPFRALLIEDGENAAEGSDAAKAFEQMHSRFGSKFVFGKVTTKSSAEVTQIQKDFPDVRSLPALLVSQAEYSEVFDGSLTSEDDVAKFFEHMSDKQTRVEQEEKPHISHTSFSLIFVVVCAIGVVGCVVVARGRGKKTADTHKSA